MYSTTMADNGNLLERRQQAGFFQQLDLPSLPPLSHLMTDKQPKTEVIMTPNTQAAAVAALAAASEVSSSMITSTNQSINDLYTHSNTTTTNQPASIMTTAPLLQHVDTQQQLLNSILTQDGIGLPPQFISRQRQNSVSSNSSDKIYSFVTIPGTNQKKRPRRRYDEIERLYHCTWSGCTKSYGTLNHLNAHVSMQQHGPKRHPSEFKEMRKEWRRQKKAREAAKKSAELVYQQQLEQDAHQLLQNHPFPFQSVTATTTATTVAQPFIPSTSTLGQFY